MREDHVREVLSRLGVDAGETNASGWVVCACPLAEFYHDSGKDNRPSFFVHTNNAGTSGFNCFTCKQTGTIGGLVRKIAHLRGTDLSELSLDAECYDMPDEWGDYEEGRSFELAEPIEDGDLILDSYPTAWEQHVSREYLQLRGISESTSDLLHLRFDPEARRIVFPVMDNEQQLFGMTGRSIIPDARVKVKDYFGLKKEQLLLGEHLYLPPHPMSQTYRRQSKGVIVEGLFALAHLVEIGVLDMGFSPVATMGANVSEHQADRLSDLFEEVYMIYDDDLAGDIGLYGRQDTEGHHDGHGAVEALRSLGVTTHVPLYPFQTGDPDELTRDQLAEMIDAPDQ